MASDIVDVFLRQHYRCVRREALTTRFDNERLGVMLMQSILVVIERLGVLLMQSILVDFERLGVILMQSILVDIKRLTSTNTRHYLVAWRLLTYYFERLGVMLMQSILMICQFMICQAEAAYASATGWEVVVSKWFLPLVA